MNFESFNLGSGLTTDQISRSLFKFTALDDKSRSVLADVYAKLAVGCVVAAIGAYLGTMFNISGFIPMMAATFCMYKMRTTPDTFYNYNWRAGYYYGACGLYGVSLSLFLYYHYVVAPSILVTASVMTVLLFGSFTVAALTARRREYFYLAGTLMTATSGLFWVGLANIFFQSPMVHNLRMYGGLLVFNLWVLVDTQVMIDRIESGCCDSFRHALELFLDLVNIFMHIVRILGDNERNKRNNRNRDQ